MRWPTATTTTLDETSKSHLLTLTEDEDGSWIVSDHETTVYGHGRNLLEAFADYWAALHSTLSIIETHECGPPISCEEAPIRRLLGLSK